MMAGGDQNEDWKSELRPLKKALRLKYANLGLHPTVKEMDENFKKDDLDLHSQHH